MSECAYKIYGQQFTCLLGWFDVGHGTFDGLKIEVEVLLLQDVNFAKGFSQAVAEVNEINVHLLTARCETV
jgi:hypothetical protein